MGDVVSMVRDLPPDLQHEVEAFVEHLLETKAKPKQRRLRLDWAGALRDYRDRYTSLELQRKVFEQLGE